jgi:choline dehydrogenase-like flavoprotein
MNHVQSPEFRERVIRNQRTLVSNLRDTFDFVICGAGTSGSVIAARLAADSNLRILVLEAGGSDDTELVMNPNRWRMTLGTDLDWGFVAEKNPRLNERAIPYSMGKVLGGGSSINVSIWSRGHRADWDFYAREARDKNWGYDAGLDLYRDKIESWSGAADPGYRGGNGAVHVQPAAVLPLDVKKFQHASAPSGTQKATRRCRQVAVRIDSLVDRIGVQPRTEGSGWKRWLNKTHAPFVLEGLTDVSFQPGSRFGGAAREPSSAIT